MSNEKERVEEQAPAIWSASSRCLLHRQQTLPIRHLQARRAQHLRRRALRRARCHVPSTTALSLLRHCQHQCRHRQRRNVPSTTRRSPSRAPTRRLSAPSTTRRALPGRPSSPPSAPITPSPPQRLHTTHRSPNPPMPMQRSPPLVKPPPSRAVLPLLPRPTRHQIHPHSRILNGSTPPKLSFLPLWPGRSTTRTLRICRSSCLSTTP
jgi:hypothetical protein